MKISILLPYKENFSPSYPGAVSIFVKDTIKCSKYKKDIQVYGSTKFKKTLLNNYINLPFKKGFFKSSSKIYVENFLRKELKKNSDIIEIHNRPSYVNQIFNKTKAKIVLYFHNDPLDMNNSKSEDDRMDLINKVEKIIFNSEWSKKRFLKGLNNFYHKSKKLIVIYQSTSRVKINLKKKRKNYYVCWKTKQSKGI